MEVLVFKIVGLQRVVCSYNIIVFYLCVRAGLCDSVCLCALASTRKDSEVFYCIKFEIVHDQRQTYYISVTSAVDCKVSSCREESLLHIPVVCLVASMIIVDIVCFRGNRSWRSLQFYWRC